MSEHRHVPVLLDRIVALVSPALQDPESVLVDATLGMGGHTEAILRACPQAHVVGLDRDPQALELAGARLAPYAGRTTLVHAVYDEIREVLGRLGVDRVQGVLFDLGVSSLQLDEARARLRLRPGRPAGHADGPDHRADGRGGAQHLLGAGPGPHPVAVRRGAVRPPDRANASSASASAAPFDTSARLVELVRASIPAARAAYRRQPGQAHLPGPADRGQRRARRARAGLAGRGRRARARRPDRRDVLPLPRGPARQARARPAGARSTAPPDLPIVPEDQQPELRLITRGAEQADAAEIAANPRAASVRVRAAERIREAVAA